MPAAACRAPCLRAMHSGLTACWLLLYSVDLRSSLGRLSWCTPLPCAHLEQWMQNPHIWHTLPHCCGSLAVMCVSPDPASKCSVPPQTPLSSAGPVPAVCSSKALASLTRCCAGAGRRGRPATGELCRQVPCPRCPSGLGQPAGGSGSPAPGPEPGSPVPVPRTPHG